MLIASGYFMHYLEYKLTNRLVRYFLASSRMDRAWISICAFVIVGLIFWIIHTLRRR